LILGLWQKVARGVFRRIALSKYIESNIRNFIEIPQEIEGKVYMLDDEKYIYENGFWTKEELNQMIYEVNK